jgi:hypothetical protein
LHWFGFEINYKTPRGDTSKGRHLQGATPPSHRRVVVIYFKDENMEGLVGNQEGELERLEFTFDRRVIYVELSAP